MISARVLSDLVDALALASFCTPCGKNGKGVYEESDDVEDVTGDASRVLLVLSWAALEGCLISKD